MTSFSRFYDNNILNDFSIDDIEELIKNEINKKIIAEIIYQRNYNRFLKIFFYKSLKKNNYIKENNEIQLIKSQNDFNTEYKNGFLILTSCCLLIETMESFLKGSDRAKKSGDRTFNYIFQKAGEYDNDLKIFLNLKFYSNIRCGLLHQGETYGKFKITRKGVLYDQKTKKINAKLFCDLLNEFLISYKEELENEDWESQVWIKCRKKITHIITNSRKTN